MPVTTYPIHGKTIPFTFMEIVKQLENITDRDEYIKDKRKLYKWTLPNIKHDDERSFIQDSWGTLIEDPIPSSIHIPAITK